MSRHNKERRNKPPSQRPDHREKVEAAESLGHNRKWCHEAAATVKAVVLDRAEGTATRHQSKPGG